ncbi:MAG: D-glycero-alpha-D-manno-heptose-1,7-bisphosphate 7-phosphatase [Bacteroidota bacterium]
MNKAVFLDRDGVLIKERGEYTFKIEDMQLNPGVIESLHDLSQKGYIFIVISNQGGISKGIYTKEDADRINDEMLKQFKKADIHIKETYYCPHHPDVENCLCRKPQSLLIEKALARFHINPHESFFIGDSDRDIEAAGNAGVKGIKIEANDHLMHYLP